MRPRAARAPEVDMKRILAVALVALLAACSQKKDDPKIQYGAPRAPIGNELSAAGAAEQTLAASLVPLDAGLASQPSYGLPGLADQLAAQLGTTGVAGAPDGASAKLAGDAVRQAFDMTQMPDCVLVDQAPGLVTITWTDACAMTSTDGTVSVSIIGWLTSTGSPGQTRWHIEDHTVMTMPATPGQPAITEDVTAILDGDVTATASAIDGWARSYVLASAMGLQMGLDTTLTLENLGYQADPFCLTSGSFTVEQHWDPRPMGATYQDFPDEGWIFQFQGCGQFTVAPGST
jgi:type IV pilus biogenesis protein CpaD/CtpE